MKCSKCGKETDHYVIRTCICKECKNAIDRANYEKNKERYKAIKNRGNDNYILGKFVCF